MNKHNCNVTRKWYKPFNMHTLYLTLVFFKNENSKSVTLHFKNFALFNDNAKKRYIKYLLSFLLYMQ